MCVSKKVLECAWVCRLPLVLEGQTLCPRQLHVTSACQNPGTEELRKSVMQD